MSVKIDASWKKLLQDEFSKEYFTQLRTFVRSEYSKRTIYPAPANIFAAFDKTPVNKTKVVILGQDPYHGPGQANGLAFSVNPGIQIPPSLRNIYKELHEDIGVKIPPSGDLTPWAHQGVLLLNATLTVSARQAGSHQNKGWEEFTDAVIQAISKKKKNLVFILWGSYAQKKGNCIDSKNHLILKAPHPSPLSAHRGFFGSKPFSKTNAYLEMNGINTINWYE